MSARGFNFAGGKYVASDRTPILNTGHTEAVAPPANDLSGWASGLCRRQELIALIKPSMSRESSDGACYRPQLEATATAGSNPATLANLRCDDAATSELVNRFNSILAITKACSVKGLTPSTVGRSGQVRPTAAAQFISRGDDTHRFFSGHPLLHLLVRWTPRGLI